MGGGAGAMANGDTQKPLSRIERAEIIVAAKRPLPSSPGAR